MVCFLNTSFISIYIFIYMLHFIKNEEILTVNYENEKWRFTLEENEYAQSFYNRFKENKLEYNFEYSSGILKYSDYPESGPSVYLEGIAPYSIILNNNKELTISATERNENCAILGKIIDTETISYLISKYLVSGDYITLTFEREVTQKESSHESSQESSQESKYYIDLLILVIFIIVSLLLILCIISSLYK